MNATAGWADGGPGSRRAQGDRAQQRRGTFASPWYSSTIPSEDSRPIGQQIVGRRGRAKCKPMADQRPHVEPRRFHQLQYRLEVSLFGPAHQTEGIVDTAVLVHLVIASGSVGTRHLEGNFLLVEIRAIQLPVR